MYKNHYLVFNAIEFIGDDNRLIHINDKELLEHYTFYLNRFLDYSRDIPNFPLRQIDEEKVGSRIKKIAEETINELKKAGIREDYLSQKDGHYPLALANAYGRVKDDKVSHCYGGVGIHLRKDLFSLQDNSWNHYIKPIQSPDKSERVFDITQNDEMLKLSLETILIQEELANLDKPV